MSVLVDISEAKRISDALRTSEIRYRRLFESAHDGVLLVDVESRQITDANPMVSRLLGFSHAQLVGKAFRDSGLVSDDAANDAFFEQLREQERRYHLVLPDVAGRGGQVVELEGVATLYEEAGRAVSQLSLRDVTERRQAESLLRQSNQRFRMTF